MVIASDAMTHNDRRQSNVLGAKSMANFLGQYWHSNGTLAQHGFSDWTTLNLEVKLLNLGFNNFFLCESAFPGMLLHICSN